MCFSNRPLAASGNTFLIETHSEHLIAAYNATHEGDHRPANCRRWSTGRLHPEDVDGALTSSPMARTSIVREMLRIPMTRGGDWLSVRGPAAFLRKDCARNFSDADLRIRP